MPQNVLRPDITNVCNKPERSYLAGYTSLV
jgi:hypothetical protein